MSSIRSLQLIRTGKLKGYSVKLKIDEKAIPRAQPQRRIPFHLRKKVKEAITQLEKEGIIEAVPENAPLQWVSPIVVVPKKDGSVRLCVDMRVPNTAIKRYRNTPHSTTKIAPSELLFNRKVQGKFPTLEKHRAINKHKEARINEERSRSYQETYANKRRKARKRNLQAGDTVLVRQQKRDKLTTRFSKTPYKVVNRKESPTITAEDSNHRRVARNVSFLKKIINNYQKRAQMSDSEDVNQSNRATYAREQEVPRPAERLVRKRYAPVRYGESIPLDTL
eukprot:gene10249-18940_t